MTLTRSELTLPLARLIAVAVFLSTGVLLAGCVSQERLTLDTAPVDGRSVGLATTGTIQVETVNGHACFWVETSDGTAVSLVWPEGATAASEPLRVEDRDGVTIASVGDEGTKLGGIPSDEPGCHASTTRFIIAP